MTKVMNSQCDTLMMPDIPTLIDQGEIVKNTDMVCFVEDSSDELSMSHSRDTGDSNSK